MWEAFSAFHICIACFLPELLRRPVVERAVRTLAVVTSGSVRVHHVKRVEVVTDPFAVERRRWSKKDWPDLFGSPSVPPIDPELL
jgi:hypothetical protein